MIQRFSSRTQPLSRFLPELLQGAARYDRIAGYFSSSMLDLAGEAIEQIPCDSVRVGERREALADRSGAGCADQV